MLENIRFDKPRTNAKWTSESGEATLAALSLERCPCGRSYIEDRRTPAGKCEEHRE